LKQYLLTAGPTPVPERVLLALARPMLYHRAPAFTECLKETQEGLKWLFQTRQIVLQLAGSGTLAMEAAVSNFLRTGDKALVIRGGKFGERWAKITQAFGIETVTVDVEWGKGVDPAAVAAALDKDPDIRAVYATASETSTGVRHDIEGISKVVRGRPDVLLCVDAITANVQTITTNVEKPKCVTITKTDGASCVTPKPPCPTQSSCRNLSTVKVTNYCGCDGIKETTICKTTCKTSSFPPSIPFTWHVCG